MTIVDWGFIGANFLWIFGVALIVAAFSYLSWLSQTQHRPIFREPWWRLSVNVGLSLVVLAVVVMPRSERWFVRLIAFALGVVLVWNATRIKRSNSV